MPLAQTSFKLFFASSTEKEFLARSLWNTRLIFNRPVPMDQIKVTLESVYLNTKSAQGQYGSLLCWGTAGAWAHLLKEIWRTTRIKNLIALLHTGVLFTVRTQLQNADPRGLESG